MKNRIWIGVGVSCVLLWGAAELLGRGGGGRGGGGGGGGGRGGGGFSGGGGGRGGGGGFGGGGGGGRPAGGFSGGGNRTPSFSTPGGGRPGGGAIGGGRPAQLPAGGGRPGGGNLTPGSGRPEIGSRPTQLPAGGGAKGIGGGGRGQISTLPSTRPDVGGRPGTGGRPGISTLPALGVGAAAGAGLANRVGDRPGRLPGLGDGGLKASQLPANRSPEQRRDALQERLSGKERPSQQPGRDWNQTREDWQQHRDQIREDWQQHRDEAREDWQNWLGDNYGRYGGWYGGYAPGYWGRWDYMWDNYPVAAAMGVTWWGANRLGYAFGCSDYSNPYYEESMPVDYSAPILTMPMEPAAETASPSALPPGVSAEAVAKFDQARAAFREGNYEQALKLTDAAVAQMPRDAVLHEFRSLVLFALGRYAESAAAIHAVLDVGPGWDWKTLSSLYPSVDVYTTQLRALEDVRDKNPKAADVRFLLGYHYLSEGYPDAALDEFKRAAKLQPRDTVAAKLAATLAPRDATATAPPPSAAAPKAVPADKIIGAWKAEGPRSSRYSMTLRKEGTFSWGFQRGSRKEEAKGVYTVEGNVLAMEPDTGGVLLAEITVDEPQVLLFKMIGGPANDPPLLFRRGASK